MLFYTIFLSPKELFIIQPEFFLLSYYVINFKNLSRYENNITTIKVLLVNNLNSEFETRHCRGVLYKTFIILCYILMRYIYK